MAMKSDEAQNSPSHFSVLIIGAGINGCGTFRDLCLQGVDCLLIDKSDVCSGASAAPSRLIHGGIKYLETHEFKLVKESAMERNRLLRNAPHYVKPLEVVCPSKSWFGGLKDALLGYLGFRARIKERGAVLIEIGLRIYDFYSRKVQALPDHRFCNKSELREEFPAITHQAVAAGLYYEGRVTLAERLALELVQDGLAAQPKSKLHNYTQIDALSANGQLTLKDMVTGEMISVTADVIINASGAWIDKVNAGLGISSNYMGGSRGAHLIVKHRGLIEALQGRMMYFGCKDGRFNLMYPFFGNVLVGSTDLPQKDPDLAHCSREEADYLLSVASEVFPHITLTKEDVVLTYSGVRPLPRADGKDIGDVSRDHSIGYDRLSHTNIPVLSLIGGKWTTFRAFSEQACNVVLAHLNKQRIVSTTDMSIGGGHNFPHDEKSRNAFTKHIGPRGETLLERYGTKALAVQDFASSTQDRPLVSVPDYSRGEIAYICANENIRHLTDLLFRRTSIAMEGNLSLGVIHETAKIAADTLSWSTSRTKSEIEHAEKEWSKRDINKLRPA
jgi:glycerol-3-phosphate dehydrogenase